MFLRMPSTLNSCLDRPGLRELGKVDTRASLKEPAKMGRTRKTEIGGNFLGRFIHVIKIPFCLQNDPPLN